MSEDPEMADHRLVLLTGATGYVGGRLLPLLQRRGIRVRCMTRRPASLADRVADTTEIIQGDVLDPDSVERALSGVDTAYYFVHSMGAKSDFEQEDREAALKSIAREITAASSDTGFFYFSDFYFHLIKVKQLR